MLCNTALEFQNSLAAQFPYSSLLHYKISITLIMKNKQFNIRQNSNHLYNEVQYQFLYQTPQLGNDNAPGLYSEGKRKGKASPRGLDRPLGFQEVEPTRFQDNWNMKVGSLSALHTGRL
jgi:hypothetical protein